MTPLSLINELALDLEKLSKTLLLVVEKTTNSPAQENVEKQEAQSVKQEQPKQEAVKTEKASGTDSSNKEEKPVVTIEQVRAVLAEKSQAGLTSKVKELLESFGANKLSAVTPEDYEKLLAAAKELK